MAGSDIFLVNLANGDYMVADDGALRDRGMPDGFAMGENVTTQAWLDAIAEASGNPSQPLAEREDLHEVFVDLSTGASRSQHLGMTRDHGAPHGYADLDALTPADFLDALREARGMDPIDRADIGEPATASP